MKAAMMTGMRLTLLFVGLTCASAVTPIEKVVGLLRDLQAKVEKQGANEAAQYDKYACFCKNQAGFKKNAIDKSKEQIQVLKADIADLSAKIKSNNEDIKDLGEDIVQLKSDIEKAVDKREKEHELYQAKAKDLNEAIDSCGEAVEALKASKAGMSDAKLNLAQLKKVALSAQVEQSPEALDEAVKLMRSAKKAAQESSGSADTEGAPKFQYQSNEIIATIQKLEATFKSNKADMDEEEYNTNSRHEKQVLGWTNEKTFKNKEKKEKEKLVAQCEEDKAEAEKSKDDENANKDSDNDFLTTLTSSCEQKAKDWDQRSKARADEMAALAEAERTLAEGALNRYSANKKLTGLVETAPKDPVKKVAAPAEKPAPKQETSKKVVEAKKAAPSFLQIRNVGSSQAAVIQRVLSNLDSASKRLGSPVLAAVALKVQLGEDHFTNVRALIKDLIKKLKDDATSEKTTKKFCDLEMSKAVDQRDEANTNIEAENGIIAKKTALAEEKADEIEGLSNEIAELNKDLLDAEELRKAEKASNAETVAEAKAGAAAVKSALQVLKGFYGIQTVYKPPKSDRYGETVADAAPEAFSGEYKGLGDSAGGIMGILEVIQSDFERTDKTTKDEEKKAADDHKEYVDKAKKDITEKAKKKEDAATEKKDAEKAAFDAKDDLHDAKNSLENAEAELEKLSPLCVQGEETYAERVAKRQEEIAALKEAYQLLDDWQN